MTNKAPLPRFSTPDSAVSRAVDTMAGFDMVQKGDAILIGISGGPDSVALTRMLLTVQDQWHLTLGLAHLNHMSRGKESFRDEKFVTEFAAENKLPLFLERQDIDGAARQAKQSFEETGRTARYDLFTRLAQKHCFKKIALGHNRDDNAEQVLMALTRGAGPAGLKGIVPQRQNIIRPLIRLTKSQILDYLDRVGQSYVLDQSNQDPSFLRNRVRHRLIPFLETGYNPKIRESLDRLSRILQEEEDYLTIQARKGLEACQQDQAHDYIVLSIETLSACHPALVSRILRAGLSRVKKDLRRISMAHVREIRDFMDRAESGKHLDLPGQIRVYKNKDLLTLRKEALPLRELGRRQKHQAKFSGAK